MLVDRRNLPTSAGVCAPLRGRQVFIFVAAIGVLFVGLCTTRVSWFDYISVTYEIPELDGNVKQSRSLSRKLTLRTILVEEIEETSVGGVEVGVIHTGHEKESRPATRTKGREPPPTINTTDEDSAAAESGWGPFAALEWLASNNSSNLAIDRCDWLWNEFEQHTSWMPSAKRAERYEHQATGVSSYYRATSHIFWVDFVLGNWSRALLWSQVDGIDDWDEYSTYTWVSGDQHLFNFGTWKNRHGDVVYGMNDFDEGAVHDFQVDVTRLAVSIYDQMLVGLGSDEKRVDSARRVLRGFLDSYVKTVRSFVGNEDALITDLTPETAMGSVKAFLEGIRDDADQYSRANQVAKYAKYRDGEWRFKKGTMEKPKHKLVEISPDLETSIRLAFSATEYGGSLLKFGWSLKGRWDEEYYEVLDVAARVGSGVGSYGVDRYYVLIRGENVGDDPTESGPFILDVKHQPPGSFRHAVLPSDAAWYDKHFAHAAARVTEAQRQLTAFTDPFTGWVLIDDKPFTVRDRSPWKESFDLGTLDDEDAFLEFVVQLGITTATSHVRGNVAEAPGDFKNVIDTLMSDKDLLDAWSTAVIDLTSLYYEQVLVDFECFQSRVHQDN